jgi:protein TonB
VKVEILIDKTGRVAKTRVVKSIPELDAAALECVRDWVFQPAQKGGQPVSTVASAPVTFKITDKKK